MACPIRNCCVLTAFLVAEQICEKLNKHAGDGKKDAMDVRTHTPKDGLLTLHVFSSWLVDHAKCLDTQQKTMTSGARDTHPSKRDQGQTQRWFL